ncbi:unnamed protein product [Onchocerca flexuosa]|uniref:Coiled-coil domain-containing protein 149 n=1 Tax=Onchocerca flexuosa TaxID=387005 RepID=A0A183H2U3_9BILA|nr:unnamed protein product [Onchocerca flexuosa]
MTNPRSVRNEVDELEKRLVKMDVKLQTAKKARDEYVNFLRQKYPCWKPPEMHIFKQSSASNQSQRCILDNLATNKYHWDLGKRLIMPLTELDDLEPNDPIPSRQDSIEVFCSGPAMEPDLIRIKKRLGEIAEDLENLREHRLHLSTAEYYLSLGSEFCSSKSQEMPWKPTEEESNVAQLKSLHELRKQIKQIDTYALLDTPRPDAESHEWMRMEYLQKYSNGETEKKKDNQKKGKFEQSLTDEKKNSNMLSIEHQKESSHLQDAQWTKANSNCVVIVIGEANGLHQILNMQRDSQKSSNQEVTDTMVAARSRPTEIESTAQTSHLSTATEDGFSFLAKILGSSADDAANKKSTFTDRLTDEMLKTVNLNDEDSDSDFFA